MATTSVKANPNNTNNAAVGPKIPHLIKWIKHRVNKKENRYTTKGRSYTTEDVENIVSNSGNGLSSISKETLQDSGSSLLDSTQDSIDTNLTSFSGNTIVSDSSSYEAADVNNKRALINKPGAITSASSGNAIINNPGNIQHINTQLPQSTMVGHGVRTVNNNQNTPLNAAAMDVSICKHGSLTNRCRSCMQLPPLPPGSERVLRELQRQAKQKLRSQSQVQFSSTGNISCSPELSRSSNGAVRSQVHRNSFQSHAPANSQTNFQLQAPANLQSQLGYMQGINHNNTGNTHFVVHNNGNNTMPPRTMALSPRLTATSPEHVYEEIPSSFFQHGQTYLHHPHHNMGQTVQNHPNNSQSNHVDMRYNRNNHLSGVSNNNGRPYSMHGYLPPENTHTVNNRNTTGLDVAAKTQLKSHEFYPQNMHSQPTKRQSPSKQVSLGNLDFGMAKQCDGFLVVPLRDKGSNSSSPHTNTSVNDNNRPQFWVKDQSSANKQQRNNTHYHHVENVNDSSINSVNSNIHSRPVLHHSNSYHHVNHNASDSGFHDGSNHDLRQQYIHKAQQFQPIYSHGRTHSVDAVNSETSEKFSHCKRCKRPHALYHGVSLCHSDVEDMRQELQYLDIAGLDKNKLRGNTSVLSSPSLLQNFARRRSAFSKYIPSPQKEDKTGSDHHSDNMPNEEDCNMRNDESGTVISDSYKRQSMSAESDYFSSNYNTSQSDTLSRASREYHSQSRANYVASASDRSNDTYSEYDVQADYQHQREDSGSVEYNFYLAKVKQNLKIKQEVKRIIRSSESERSDCERSYQSDSNFLQDDSISLTSVTSLSELSTMPMEESSTSFVRSRGLHKVSKGSPKSSKTHHSNIKNNQPGASADSYVSKMQRVRKPIRKKRKSPKDVEYYKLPNFSANSTFQQYDSKSNSDSSRKADTTVKLTGQETKSSGAMKIDNRAYTPSHDSSSSCYSVDSVKSSDKLSCRVTDFKMTDIKRSASISSRDANKTLSVRATSNDQNDQKSTRSSVYSSHNQVKNNNNNRLLSDLMRMNHDRQLFSFI